MKDSPTSFHGPVESLADSMMYLCIYRLCNNAQLQVPMNGTDIEKKRNTNRESFVDWMLVTICDRFDLIFEKMYSVCPSVQVLGKFSQFPLILRFIIVAILIQQFDLKGYCFQLCFCSRCKILENAEDGMQLPHLKVPYIYPIGNGSEVENMKVEP